MKRSVPAGMITTLAVLFFVCLHSLSYADEGESARVTQPDAGSPVAVTDPVAVTPGTGLSPDAAAVPDSAAPADKERESMIKMHGLYGLSMGFTTDDFLWKSANGDWQEKNWRYAFGDLDVNTYDPRIFDRYELEIETDTKTPWNGYADIVIDPWSFVQVGHQVAFNAAQTNRVDVDYKGWENTGYTINQRLRTYNGTTIFTPEQKILSNKVTPSTVSPVFGARPVTNLAGELANQITFSPESSVKMDYIYRPVRKLWVEYNESPFYLKIFPIADQAEALTSDDPLTISNNHVYWAPSPWLWRFDPGMTFDPTSGIAQQPALWNWDEQWFAEDSNRNYLTFLRGVSAGWSVEDFASLNVTAAAPLGLWDTYETVTSIPIAARFKMNPTDRLTLGSTYTSKYGIAKQEVRGQNQVLAADVTYSVWDKTDLYGELAGSFMGIEHASGAVTNDTGQACKVGIRSEIKFNAENSVKNDAYFGYMSENFSPGLADYRDTREDRDWGRHIWFDSLSEEDQASRIGDGIDINRYTVGANSRMMIMDNLFDVFMNVRNVHEAADNNKFVENTARVEVTYTPQKQVQFKGLALVRNYHDSLGGFDPTIRDRYTDRLYKSLSTLPIAFPQTFGGTVEDGQDVNVMTFSGGVKVDLVPDVLSVYGIYEATNDPQDFPRQILNNPLSEAQYSYTHDDVRFNQLQYGLYSQSLFNLPPYDSYFSMWKGSVTFKPVKDAQIRYVHVTNTNQNYAALFDNNHTHDEITLTVTPYKGITWTTGCSVSRVIDLARAVDTSSLTTWPFFTISPWDREFQFHTNVYSQINWDFKKDQRLTLQFGEAWLADPQGSVFGPAWVSQNVSVLDTRAIFRVWYQGKF